MVGRTVHQYHFVEKLGAGGMGEIFKAQDTRLNRFVAIKVLAPASAGDSERRRRFLQEAQSASALNHPNIITIHDIVTEGEAQFLVMEYVQGKTLSDTIPKGGLRVPQVLKYSIQMADALHAAHAARIIHRDLKPSNVMVTESGLVKILDFGLAKLTGLSTVADLSSTDETKTIGEAPLTVEGAIIGTVSYMSPEQAQGKKVDPRSDIFSMGLVMYEMVTGARAFAGDSALSTLSAILRDEARAIADLTPDVPAELEQLISKCLRKNADDRWQSMKELQQALGALKLESDSGILYRSRLSVTSVPAALAAATSAGVSAPPPTGAVTPALPLMASPPPPAPPAPPPPRSAPVMPPPMMPQPPGPPGYVQAPVPYQPPMPPPRRGGKGAPAGLIIGLAAGVVVLLGAAGGAAWWWMNRAPAEPLPEPPVIAEAPPPPPLVEPPPQQPATPAPAASKPVASAKPAASKSQPQPPAPTPAPTAPVESVTAPPTPTPVPAPPPKPALAETVSVPLKDGLPFTISLTQNIPESAEAGMSLRFIATREFRSGDVLVIPKGAQVTGQIAEGARRRLIGSSKMTLRLIDAETVNGGKVRVRALPGRRNDGKHERPVDTGARQPKDMAAAAGTEYIAYIDGDQTATVPK
jgi:serine/threonine-protein kinase